MDIQMKTYWMKQNGWKEEEPSTFRRVSRWIAIQQNYNPTKDNRLWDYAEDGNGRKPYDEKFDPSDGVYLHYFRFRNRTYAVEQFLRLGSFFTCVTYSYEDKDGKERFLSAVDGEDYYHPLYAEFDEYCEHVRLYEKVA